MSDNPASHTSHGNHNRGINSEDTTASISISMRNQREMCVYAGKVHVRGLLRRVWRPRYLAMGDDGYLRYHESMPPLLHQDPDHEQPGARHSCGNTHSLRHTHRPKRILAVLDGARTIDPSSVVDRHVALPVGVRGFVFRGRPVELHATDPDDTGEAVPAAEQDAVILPATTDAAARTTRGDDGAGSEVPSTRSRRSLKKKAAVVNLVFPKGTARRTAAQSIAKKALNPDVLCDCGAGGISHSSSSSSLGHEEVGDDGDDGGCANTDEWGRHSHESQGTLGSFQAVEGAPVDGELNYKFPDQRSHRIAKNVQHGPSPKPKPARVQVHAPSVQSREYLCAVATAEEAESWVVALRWAAERRRGSRSTSRATLLEVAPASGGNVVEREHHHPGLERERKRTVGTSDDAASNSDNSEGHNRKSDEEGSGDTPEDTTGGSIRKDHGGKASLASLALEQDGWCKAESEQNAREEEGANSGARELSPPSTAAININARGPMRDKSSVQFTSPSLPSVPKKNFGSFAGATIIVTRVSKFRLPQISVITADEGGNPHNVPWIPFHLPLPGDGVALIYQIELLLLRNCKPRTEMSVQPGSVEERTIYKSAHEVLVLVRDLMTESGTVHDLMAESDAPARSNSTQGGRGHAQFSPLSKGDDTFHMLQKMESTLLSCLKLSADAWGGDRTSGNPIADLSSATLKALASVGTMDSVMRNLSKDGSVCSSCRFEEFLDLRATHRHYASLSTTPEGTADPTTVSEQADAEQIVRKWLAQIDHPTNATLFRLSVAICLRHKLGGPLLSLLAMWSVLRLISMLWCVISGSAITISVPVENYATIILLSFLVGNNFGVSSRPKFKKENLQKQPSKVRRRQSQDSGERPKGGNFSSEMTVDNEHSTVADEECSEFDENGSGSDEETLLVESLECSSWNPHCNQTSVVRIDEQTAIHTLERKPTQRMESTLPSPLPLFPANHGISCWSNPDPTIFMVRGANYLKDRIKIPSAPAVFPCRGVDLWITDNPERNISRHPSVLGGKLREENSFVVNFLLPFGNFVSFFTVPPIQEFPSNIADVWYKFVRGDQQYRDRTLKLLPIVIDGPWIVKKAVGPGNSPAVIGRDLPLQYYFTESTPTKKGVYEIDVLVTASRIARGILNVVKGHTRSLTIAFALIIEASEEAQLPETILCAFQVHSLHLEHCPNLPESYPGG